MGLKETIAETKKQLEEVVEKEAEEEKSALEEFNKKLETAIEPEKKDEAKIEEKPEDKKDDSKAEEKSEEKSEEKPVEKTGREERIAKKRDQVAEELARAQAKIADLEAKVSRPVEEVKTTSNEPDAVTNPLGWTAWKIQQLEEKVEPLAGRIAEQDTVKSQERLREQAISEVQVFENKLRQNAPDYDDVKNYYARMIGTSIKIVNPRITDLQLGKAVEQRLLTRAAELLGDGYENPIEAMYLEAKSLGYQPKQYEKAEEKEPPKPDMDKVAKLRGRNAGMAGSSGAGGDGGEVTAKVAATMTNAEFARLKPEQKKRLFASLR